MWLTHLHAYIYREEVSCPKDSCRELLRRGLRVNEIVAQPVKPIRSAGRHASHFNPSIGGLHEHRDRYQGQRRARSRSRCHAGAACSDQRRRSKARRCARSWPNCSTRSSRRSSKRSRCPQAPVSGRNAFEMQRFVHAQNAWHAMVEIDFADAAGLERHMPISRQRLIENLG